MGISREYRAFIADVFSTAGDVEVQSMFGGAGIYRGGIMFGLVTSDEGVFLKADETTCGRFEAEGLGQFVYTPPDASRPPIAMPYWRMPERLLEDPDELAEWANAAYEVAVRTHKPKKPKSGAKRKTAPSPK